jgi:hypothetical protein
MDFPFLQTFALLPANFLNKIWVSKSDIKFGQIYLGNSV